MDDVLWSLVLLTNKMARGVVMWRVNSEKNVWKGLNNGVQLWTRMEKGEHVNKEKVWGREEEEK